MASAEYSGPATMHQGWLPLQWGEARIVLTGVGPWLVAMLRAAMLDYAPPKLRLDAAASALAQDPDTDLNVVLEFLRIQIENVTVRAVTSEAEDEALTAGTLGFAVHNRTAAHVLVRLSDLTFSDGYAPSTPLWNGGAPLVAVAPGRSLVLSGLRLRLATGCEHHGGQPCFRVGSAALDLERRDVESTHAYRGAESNLSDYAEFPGVAQPREFELTPRCAHVRGAEDLYDIVAACVLHAGTFIVVLARLVAAGAPDDDRLTVVAGDGFETVTLDTGRRSTAVCIAARATLAGAERACEDGPGRVLVSGPGAVALLRAALAGLSDDLTKIRDTLALSRAAL